MDFITLKEILFPALHIERKNVCVLNLGDFFPPFLILFKLGLPEITYCWKIQWIWWIYKRIYKDTQVCLGIQKKQKFMLDWIIISNYLQFPNSLGIYIQLTNLPQLYRYHLKVSDWIYLLSFYDFCHHLKCFKYSRKKTCKFYFQKKRIVKNQTLF